MRKFFALSALFVVVSATAFAGRGDKAGTAAATELLIPIGAEAIALGGSSLATVTGIEAMYWNPAGIVRASSSTNAMFSHMSYVADIGVDYGAVSTNIPEVASVAIGVKSLSFGKIPVTTEDYPDGTGKMASPAFVMLSGAVSRLITDRIALGVSATAIFENMEKVSATGIAFSFGLQYAGLGGVDGLSVGVVVNNIGPAMKFEGDGLQRIGQVDDVLRPPTSYTIEAASNDLPSTIDVGLGYIAILSEREQVTLTTVFRNNNYSDDEYDFGAEVTYDHVFALRGGYSAAPQSEGGEYIFGFSAGIGVRARIEGIDLSVDYAYRGARYFGGNSVVGIRASF